MEGSIRLFGTKRQGQSASLAAEFAGNSPEGGLRAVVFSGGAAAVR